MQQQFRAVRYLIAVITTLACVGCTGCARDDTKSGANAAKNRDYYLPYVAPGTGLSLVDASDFGKILTSVVGDASQIRLFAAVPPLGVEPRMGSPYAVLALSGSQWYRVWLTKDKSQAPAMRGSPVTATVCSTQVIYLDLNDPDTGILRFKDAGQNQTCHDDDDQAHAIALADIADTAPFTFGGRLVEQIHSAAGTLEGVVLVQDNSLVLLRYPSGLSSILIQSLPQETTVASLQRMPGAVWLQIGTEWRRVSIADGLSPPRYVQQAGYAVPSAPTTDSEYIYFLETASAESHTRLWRLRLDGTSGAETIFDTPDKITYLTNTAARVWLYQDGSSTQKLWWIDKQDIPAGIHLQDEIGSGGIAYIPSRDRLMISLQDVAQNRFTVKVVDDTGVDLLQVPDAQFELNRANFPYLFDLGGNTSRTFVGLVRGSNLFQTRSGAELIGYNLESLEGKHMFTYGESLTVVASGFGAVGLGRYYVMTPTGESGPDLFAFDLENNRFALFPKTPGVNETPLEF